MGAITPVLTGLNAIRTIGGMVSKDNSYGDRQKAQQVALKQLQTTQRLQARQAADDAALNRERLAAEAAGAENARLAALRRAVARQRANFGVQGVGSDGGSSGAVLLGLFDESEDELAQREKMDDIRNRALDMGMAQRGAINTLQYTQLKERQKIGRLSAGIDRAAARIDDGLDLAGWAG